MFICAAVFRIERFKSITDFRIFNRLTHETCSVPLDQEVPVCSDALDDFTKLPFMRVSAAKIAVSDWRHGEAFRVRHFLVSEGILTFPHLATQTIWLSDGAVYTVATAGLAVGDALTLCVGRVSVRGPLRLASRLPDGGSGRYVEVFAMPLPGHRFWWQSQVGNAEFLHRRGCCANCTKSQATALVRRALHSTREP